MTQAESEMLEKLAKFLKTIGDANRLGYRERRTLSIRDHQRNRPFTNTGIFSPESLASIRDSRNRTKRGLHLLPSEESRID